jgi:pimeloyl-ACP methyl ester carboxylesterase
MSSPRTDAVEHRTEQLPGVRLHYVVAGAGEPVILLHGWSQTWYEWRHILPALAEQFTVVAPDLRGLGDSSNPGGGFDKKTVAGDVRELARRLDLGPVALVGHDHGASVAYAYAAQWPDEVRRLALVEMALIGAGGEAGMDNSGFRGLWHLSFQGAGPIADALVHGRERMYLSWFYKHFLYDPAAISEDDVDVYARAYAAPGKLGFGYYRAFEQDALDTREFAKSKLTIPVLAVGGDSCLGGIVAATAGAVAEDVREAVLPRCGHFPPEERPRELLDVLLPFLRES